MIEEEYDEEVDEAENGEEEYDYYDEEDDEEGAEKEIDFQIDYDLDLVSESDEDANFTVARKVMHDIRTEERTKQPQTVSYETKLETLQQLKKKEPILEFLIFFFSYAIALLYVLFAFYVARGISQALYSENFDYEKIFRDIEREKIKEWMAKSFYTAIALGVAYGLRRLAQRLNQEKAAHELRTFVFTQISTATSATSPSVCQRLLMHDCTVVAKMDSLRIEKIEALATLACAFCFALVLNWQVAICACVLVILTAGWILIVNHNVCGVKPVNFELSSEAQEYISESAANRDTFLRSQKGKDFETRLNEFFGSGHHNTFGYQMLSVLQPQIFGAVAPLILTPLAWIVTTYKQEKSDIFAALFILIFVCFTISMTNPNSIQETSTESTHDSVNALYDIINMKTDSPSKA